MRHLAVRAFLVAILALAAFELRTALAGAPNPAEPPVTLDAPAASTFAPSSTAEPSPTDGLVAIASPAPVPSPALDIQTPTPQVTTRPPTPSPTIAAVATPSGTPAQTRVPGSVPPTPHGLPASDGCLTYGAQPPYVTFVDCVVHGLPPGAPVTLTANGDVVFLRIGSTVVYPDGTWYFAWSENQHKEIVFVVTAGGLSRTITQVFR